MIETAYEKSIETLKQCSTKNGFFASAGKDGYNAIWARDSMITSIGASLVKDDLLKKTFRQSLITLAKNQSEKGQIPNAVDKFSKRKSHVDYQSIDSSLWYIIGHYIYKKRYRDNSLFKKYQNSIKKAVIWLNYQDTGENIMLEQLPTTDWQDAFPHKYGHVINTQALYYFVLNLIGEKTKAKKLKIAVNKDKQINLWNGNFYVPYRWKNHNKYKEIGDWFDSLANILAIVFDLAEKNQAKKIISYIKKKKIDKPYPVKAIYPPIKKGSKNWRDYFQDCDAGKPYSYANAGIWTYIGAFYVLALIKHKKYKEAENQLKKIAEANLRGNFPEWIHPKTKKSFGKLQAWDAGMYIAAYHSLKEKRSLLDI